MQDTNTDSISDAQDALLAAARRVCYDPPIPTWYDQLVDDTVDPAAHIGYI